ncbi:MAG: discoidin domain-containing protein [Chloroflexota bacterium]
MALFADDAEWTQAADRIDVFKLYGEWVDSASTSLLRTAIDGIRARGMILAVEAGPLDPVGCGEGVEGFAGSDSGRRLAQRIKEAGGTLQVIALDEPWYYAHVYGGSNACQWPVDRVAQGVAEFVTAVREEFPWVVVGDIEPTPSLVSADGLAEWMDAYHAAVGEPMAFMHLDSDWSRPNWSTLALQVEAAGVARSIPVGILYNGGGAPSDEQWVHLAGQHALDHEDRDGGRPDHVIFQSWNDHPDRVLPETDPDTFTALVNRYFDDRASLGLGGPGGNLAWRRPVTASSAYAPVENAVDGNPDTIWNAGRGWPAWIEIDLGQATSLSELRLTVAQTPTGVTEHHVWGRVDAGGELVLLGTLSGVTTDYQTLRLNSPGTWPAVRWLRIETTASPSWVAWREIEVAGE